MKPEHLMRTIVLALLASTVFESAAHAAAKSNTLVSVTQEQDQWCWTGTTRSALLYLGVDTKQCELAEWARLNNTANDVTLGSVNCCANPSGACNNWNYFWGSGGSIEDILQHFGGAKTTRYDLPKGALTLAQFTASIDAGKLAFIRWQWNNGGGHFVRLRRHAGALHEPLARRGPQDRRARLDGLRRHSPVEVEPGRRWPGRLLQQARRHGLQ